MADRILIHVQHLLGIGHLRRMQRLARSLAARGARVMLLSGGMPESGHDHGAVAFVQLPPVRARDATFAELVDMQGQPVGAAWRAARQAAVRECFERFAPDCLITELFPLGRRKFAFELLPLLEQAHKRQQRPLILASVRDVLVPPTDPARIADMLGWAARYYDRILVHGDARFLPLETSFPQAWKISRLLHYTGYLAGEGVAPRPETVPEEGGTQGVQGVQGAVLVSAGGGAVGARLLRTALHARGLSGPAAALPWRLFVGPHAARDLLPDLRAAAPAGVTVEPNRPDFPALLRGAALSISQAGYNTVTEIFAARQRAVLVPFSEARESEQTLRAAAAARHGLAACVAEDRLSAETLGWAVADALAKPVPPAQDYPALSGADQTADWILQTLAGRHG